MHIVHFRRGDPSSRLSKEPAETQPLRIAVIGVFFELVANDNEYLKPFTDVLSQVEDPTNASGEVSAASAECAAAVPAVRLALKIVAITL